MKIVSRNVRGLGGFQKRSFVRKDLRSIRVDWVAVQESKLRSLDNFVVQRIYGKRDWGYNFRCPLEWHMTLCAIGIRLSTQCQSG